MLQIFQNIAELQTTCRNRGICEVLTEDRDYSKVIAHAMPCIVREDTRVNSPTCVQLLPCASEEQSDSENKGACGREQRKHIDHIAEKGM